MPLPCRFSADRYDGADARAGDSIGPSDRHGRQGPSPELIAAIVEIKRRNPRFGYRRIAERLALVFDVEIDQDVVRRMLAHHYRPDRGDDGPSWLSLLGNANDGVWSLDLFRCESLALKSHCVMARHGSVHAAHRRLCSPRGSAGRTGRLPHAGPGHCGRRGAAAALEYRP